MYHFRNYRGRGGQYTPPDTSTGLAWSQRPPELPRFTCGLAPQTLVKFFAGLDIVTKQYSQLVLLQYSFIQILSRPKTFWDSESLSTYSLSLLPLTMMYGWSTTRKT